MEVIIAHGSGGGLGILAFFPVGLLLLVGLVLMFSPIVSQTSSPVREEDEDDVANRVLGEEEAREWRRRARRKRAVVRRRMLGAAVSGKGRDKGSEETRR